MRRGFVVLAAFLSILGFGLVKAWSQATTAEASYVGDEACAECHDREWRKFRASKHGHVDADSAVVGAGMSCESCHGAGSLHAEADGDKDDPRFHTMRDLDEMPAEEAIALCTTCHRIGDQQHWEQSEHAEKNVTCVTCHSLHSPKDLGHVSMLKAENTSDLCLDCHRDKRPMISKTAHMPVTEGGMDCSSCHNPHGSPTEANLRADTINDLCESCHADKRGPTLWEHPPVREDCTTCHEPHGSNNDKVLAGKRPFLCQRCHINTFHPATLYDEPDLANNKLFNRSCTNCHTQVHGSNHPSGKFFLR
jgi:DmsE family decaheme c-type cytochrome